MQDILIFLYLIAVVAIWINYFDFKKWIKKHRAKYEEELSIIESNRRAMYFDYRKAELLHKEAKLFSREARREHAKAKEGNQFIQSAIRSKVRKKKIRGKKRKSA